METILDVFFYLTLVPFYVVAYGELRRWVPILSLSGLFLILNFIFVVIPGYFNYRGWATYQELSELNLTAYILYYLQAIIPVLSVYTAWRWGGPPVLRIKERRGVKPLFFAVLAAVIAYDVFYTIFNAAEIPLISVFTGNFDVVALYRSLLTHGFEDSNLPWYFGYYRIFTKDLIFLLAIPCLIFTKFWKSVWRTAALFALLFLLLMHVEKAYLLYLFAAIYLAQSDFRPPSRKSIVLIAVSATALAFIVTYALFSQSLVGALAYLPARLADQTGYVVSQLDVFEQYGFLGIKGIRLGLFDKLFPVTHIDIPALTFNVVLPGFEAQGISGSTAGASMAELYMIVGYAAPVLFFLILYMLARVDRNFRVFATTKFGVDSVFSERLAKSFYIYFVCFYSLEPITSVFGIFSIVTIFAPSLLLAVLLYFMFFRVSFRIASPSAALAGI
jgi:hypothetical protein